MEIVECLDGQNVESCSAIDEGPSDLHIADDGRAEYWKGTSCGRALELVGGVEGDGVFGPPEQVRYLKLGEDCIHLVSKLLEDAL